MQINVGSYVNGVFVKNHEGSLNNVLYSQSQTQKVQNSSYLFDLNQDGVEDVIMRDQHSVYVKYGKQNELFPPAVGTRYSKFYTTSVIASLND